MLSVEPHNKISSNKECGSWRRFIYTTFCAVREKLKWWVYNGQRTVLCVNNTSKLISFLISKSCKVVNLFSPLGSFGDTSRFRPLWPRQYVWGKQTQWTSWWLSGVHILRLVRHTHTHRDTHVIHRMIHAKNPTTKERKWSTLQPMMFDSRVKASSLPKEPPWCWAKDW